jgi:1,4-alpha-glucan branching enzyme
MHGAWAVDGTPYDPDRAAAQVREHASDFVARVAGRGDHVVVPFDTELFGHWWHEGVDWLRALLEEAHDHHLPIQTLDHPQKSARHRPPTLDQPQKSARHRTAEAELPVTSWGTPRDLSTWSAPRAGGLAWVQRREELRMADPRRLLALQASDWAFLISNGAAGDYPRRRFEAHLAGDDLRSLAPHL